VKLPQPSKSHGGNAGIDEEAVMRSIGKSRQKGFFKRLKFKKAETDIAILSTLDRPIIEKMEMPVFKYPGEREHFLKYGWEGDVLDIEGRLEDL